MKQITLFLIVAFPFIFFACEKDETKPKNDRKVIISPELYKTAPQDQLTINSVKIEGDSLKINFTSSGCSGDRWDVKLIDSGAISKSIPPYRHLILSLKNDEECDAVITKDISFDIRDLQVEGTPVYIDIEGSDTKLLYKY